MDVTGMTGRSRTTSWGTPLRAVASVAMLVFLLRRVHLSSLLPSWDAEGALLLVAALAVTFAGVIAATLRWRQVLVALGLPARLGPLLSHYLAGLFVGNFLPSTIGGDVVRVRRLSGTGERPDAFASVVLERLSGWIVLPVITLSAFIINPELLRLGTATRVALGLAFATLVFLGGLLMVVAHPRLGGRLTGREGWQRFAGAVHLGLVRFRHQPGAAFRVLLAGFAYQLVVVLSAFLAARALDIEIGPTAVLAFAPAVAIAQVLPFSIGGLGLREGAFALFLSPLGVATAQAVALGLLSYGLNLTVSLIGAPAFASGPRPRPGQPLVR